MKRGADAREDRAKQIEMTEEPAKGFNASSDYLEKIYKNRRNSERKNNYQSATKQIIPKIQEEKLIADETLAGGASSIQLQPGSAAQASQRISRKTPRWQPRGGDTQSFRPLVQEERGVLRVRLLALSTRVNTLFRLWQLRLTRS